MHAIRAGFSEPPITSSSSSSSSSTFTSTSTDGGDHSSSNKNTSTTTNLSSQCRRRWSGSSGRSTTTTTTSYVATIVTLVRWLVLDTPYLILVLVLGLCRVAVYYHDEYIKPQLTVLEWNKQRATREVTYYKRLCTTADQSTSDPRELIIDHEQMSDDDMVDRMLQHGIVVVPNLLSYETATLLRSTIIKYNTIEENFGVISNQHRYSYGIRMEQDPIVRTAVKEISTHPALQKLFPKLIGSDPALYKFHAITSSYGAADQHYHWDVKASASAVGYSRSFAPLYSLFIPLQHTPVAMGPTQICPGSHVCSAGTNFCHQTAFQILLNDTMASSSSTTSTSTTINGTTTTTTSMTTTDEPVWPATYGALMNQQTTHRGRAHTLENGPDRVLFILAVTPRPRSTDHVSQLETRSLSLGGSYAIHWSQWGHTWSDLYRDTMYEPYKTLKSLGWYKPAGSYWGREFLMTALLQLANGDYWSRSNLETHLKKGKLWYIPKIFYYTLPDSYQSEEDEDLVWYHFFYGTFRNVVRWIPVLVVVALGLYTFGYSWVQLFLAVGQRQGFGPIFWGNVRAYTVRMLLFHVLAYGVAVWLRDSIDARPWSRHMRHRKMYTLPTKFPSQPVLPSTLPVPHDVLMLDDFQSDYLASYTRLYDVGHPGNARWKMRLSGVAAAAEGHYCQWPASVQDALQESLVRQVETEALGRFLMKNSLNQWARMTRSAAKAFVHKELLRSSTTTRDGAEYDVLLREIAYRRSETKFGPWRDTALHRSHIPKLLMRLENHLVTTTTTTAMALQPLSLLSAARSSRRASAVRQQSPVQREVVVIVPDAPQVSPSGGNNDDNQVPWGGGPYPGAWLQVGDRVDALFSESETYWYPGTIKEALAHSNKWVVVFDNYDKPIEVGRQFLLPLKPLEMGDNVEAKYKKQFHQGKLKAVYSDSFDFVFANAPDTVLTDVPLRRYRRPLPDFGDPEQIEYDLGEPVFALFYDKEGKSDGTLYAATVVAIEYPNPDLYTLLYADSDEVKHIHARDLRPMTYYVDQ